MFSATQSRVSDDAHWGHRAEKRAASMSVTLRSKFRSCKSQLLPTSRAPSRSSRPTPPISSVKRSKVTFLPRNTDFNCPEERLTGRSSPAINIDPSSIVKSTNTSSTELPVTPVKLSLPPTVETIRWYWSLTKLARTPENWLSRSTFIRSHLLFSEKKDPSNLAVTNLKYPPLNILLSLFFKSGATELGHLSNIECIEKLLASTAPVITDTGSWSFSTTPSKDRRRLPPIFNSAWLIIKLLLDFL